LFIKIYIQKQTQFNRLFVSDSPLPEDVCEPLCPILRFEEAANNFIPAAAEKKEQE
jgi:hypothetical protein